jgi:hypothetical protein
VPAPATISTTNLGIQPVFISALALLTLRMFARRALPHECPACLYDRRGIPDASPCPECGTPATQPKPAESDPPPREK